MDEINAVVLLVALAALFIFFLPSVIAFNRGSRHRLIILILNVALGWTGVGWLVVLAMAVWPKEDAVPVKITGMPQRQGGAGKGLLPDARARVPASARGPSVRFNQLAELAELKAAGVLSQDEFDQKKHQILAAS